MKSKSGIIGMVLGGLALVVAAGGTAYAVTASTVYIADPNASSHIANVDSSGHLLTAGALSTIDSASYLTNYQSGTEDVTSPTTASLAITRILISNPSGNGNYAAQFNLEKVATDTNGNCVPGLTETLGIYNLAAGTSTVDPLPAPLVVKSTAGAKYCLAFYLSYAQNTASLIYYPSFSVTAYVAGGTYTGTGTPLSNAKNALSIPKGPER